MCHVKYDNKLGRDTWRICKVVEVILDEEGVVQDAVVRLGLRLHSSGSLLTVLVQRLAITVPQLEEFVDRK